jgi:hypothetical protein
LSKGVRKEDIESEKGKGNQDQVLQERKEHKGEIDNQEQVKEHKN